MHARRVASLCALLFGAVACRANEPKQTDTSRTRHGDTLWVATEGPGVWDASARREPDLRIAGREDTLPFGELHTLVAHPDGGVVVVDAKAQDGVAVLRFDRHGRFVTRLGRDGDGPGEHDRLALALLLDVGPDGRIHLLGSNRWLQFDANGALIRTLRVTTSSHFPALVATDSGGICLRDTASFGAAPVHAPLRCLDESGAVRHRVADVLPWRPPSDEACAATETWWRVTRDRRVVHGQRDVIGFVLAERTVHAGDTVDESGAEGTAWRAIRGASTSREPVRFLAREREERLRHAALAAAAPRGCPAQDPGEFKPRATDVSTDLAGRVWVRRSSTAQIVPDRMKYWTASRGGATRVITTQFAEPPTFTVFDSTGALLGDLTLPIDAMVSGTHDVVWAIEADSGGSPLLVRYPLPSGTSSRKP